MRLKETLQKLTRSVSEDPQVPWIILILITAAFLVIVYPGLIITDHAYEPGDIVERDIKAPEDFLVEDTMATEANRREAEKGVLTVYDLEPALVAAISGTVEAAFEDMRQIARTTRLASLEQTSGDTPAASDPSRFLQPPPEEPATGPTAGERLWENRLAFEDRLGIALENSVFGVLVDKQFMDDISRRIARILGEVMGRGIVANKDLLLREAGKGILLRTVGTGTERIVGDLDAFYGLDQARTAVREIAPPIIDGLDYTGQNLVIDLTQRLLQPNITLNRHETEERKQAAIEAVKPVFHKIKAGEMLLREGERVTETQLLKLKALQAELKDSQVMETSLGAALLIVCLLVATYVLHSELKGTDRASTNRDLFFVATTIILFFVIGEVSASLSETLPERADLPFSAMTLGYVTPVAAATMLICLFLGLQTALHATGILAVGVAVIFHGSFDMMVFSLVSSAMAAFWVRDCRERKVFAKAGLKTGLLNVAVITAISVYHADLAFPLLGWDWTFGLIGGVLSGVLAAGIAPLVEITFGYSSDIKLLELSNLDQPIMRKLMIEAPGTYHHSVIVGSMVEAAAVEIGANPLLAKVCGYYHDIGKIKKPVYFIENQVGKNRHDKLAPSMSALILIAHIKDGVEIARKHKLGQVIIDTISQHHGTSMIRFFYEKAKAMKGEDAVKVDDYRYPGPKPQTREAGLVMLADVVEAASRTLENPTPSRIQGMVQNLVNTIFSDGQLDSCELTLKDLHSIAKVFNRILTGIHHHRVDYPERRASAVGKNRQRDGHSDRQPANPGTDRQPEAAENGTGHLKRLGLS